MAAPLTLPPGLPAEPGVAQLRWLIARVAAGEAPVDFLLTHLRPLHEAIERLGPAQFASPDEARAIWDVLWAVEFYSPNAAQEAHPEDWNTAEQVLAVVKRAAAQLAG